MNDEWQTIRIRVRVVKRLDELCAANVASVPSKTSRTDMIEAALEAYSPTADKLFAIARLQKVPLSQR